MSQMQTAEGKERSIVDNVNILNPIIENQMENIFCLKHCLIEM